MRAKGNWTSALKADPMEWLLEDDNPVVRYWTLRDAVSASASRVTAARRRLMTSPVVQEIRRQQRPEGHWEDPDNVHSPHYTSTVYQLSLLADLGLSAREQWIAKGVERLLSVQRDDGTFPGHDPRKCQYGAYDIGLVVRLMHQLGMADDPRLPRMYEWLQVHQTPEGGWVGVQGECKPTPQGCLNATANVLWGLASSGAFVGTEVARKGAGFLAQAAAGDEADRREISYPQFWNFWVDDIKLAEICLGLGVASDQEPLRSSLENMLSLQGDDGRWLEGHVPYPEDHANCRRMRQLFPKRGQPSKWVTAKAMSVLRRALGGHGPAPAAQQGRPAQ